MEHAEISKQMLELHKNALMGTMESMRWCREQAERVNDYWMDAFKVSPNVRDVIDQWRHVAKSGREDFLNMVASNYADWEAHFSRIETPPTKTEAKSKASKAKAKGSGNS
jgi:hypothetical protein